MAVSFTIRRIRADDEAVVVPLWMRGFHESAPASYERMTSSPAILAVFLALAGGVYALGWRAPAAVLAAAGALIYTPAGRSLHSSLMWTAISAQARSSMRDVTGEWCEANAAAFWVAELEGRIVGCVGAKALHTLHRERVAGVATAPRHASVWRLTVAPDARRHRVGAALMAEAERWARARGCTRLSLIAGNPASKRFYRALGYDAEEVAIARGVLFGPGGAPRGLVALAKDRALLYRVGTMRTILARDLGTAAAEPESTALQ